MDHCELCSEEGEVTTVRGEDMSRAVENGFDAFEVGTLADLMGIGRTSREWLRGLEKEAMAKRDWKLCSRCMERLRPHLATTKGSGATCVAEKAKESGPSKRWWQFWK